MSLRFNYSSNMRTIFNLLFILIWGWLFVKFPPLLYGVYFLLFFITFIIKNNYWRFQITSEQAEHYGGYNTIITFPLGLIALYGINERNLYYLSKLYGYHEFYLEHGGLIEIPLVLIIILVGLVNIATGISLPQYITNQEADYKRRQYLADLEDQEEEANK